MGNSAPPRQIEVLRAKWADSYLGDLSLKIQMIREATDYQVPIQLKLGAARVYDDVRMAAKCGPDV